MVSLSNHEVVAPSSHDLALRHAQGEVYWLLPAGELDTTARGPILAPMIIEATKHHVHLIA
ncbi:hypothetical protein ABIE28_000582 [Devosia sp. 2618]